MKLRLTSSSARQLTLIALMLLLPAQRSGAAVTLTGALQQGVDANGQTYSTPVWNTLGYELSFANLYVTQPNGGYKAPLLNSGNAAAASISVTLTPGTYEFYFLVMGFWDNNPGRYGLNLFFGGDNTTPGISAFSPVGTSTATPVEAGKSTLSLNGDAYNQVQATGSLTYTANGLNVTLTDYGYGMPGVFGGPAIDRVSNLSSAPDGYTDSVGRFTLGVTPVPEPSALTLLGIGLLALRRVMWSERKA
jgi:hypothetical protein